MSITTTAHDTFSVEDLTGHAYYTIRHRLSGTSVWTQYNTSGTTFAISGLSINMLYDFQVVNVNNTTNPASAISQAINITNPNPTISPTNVTVGYAFNNLSTDMTLYTGEIALATTPTVIIATHALSPGAFPSVVSDTFTGLTPSTNYILTIIPSSGSFYNTFTYPFTTNASAACPAPTAVSATLS